MQMPASTLLAAAAPQTSSSSYPEYRRIFVTSDFAPQSIADVELEAAAIADILNQ